MCLLGYFYQMPNQRKCIVKTLSNHETSIFKEVFAVKVSSKNIFTLTSVLSIKSEQVRRCVMKFEVLRHIFSRLPSRDFVCLKLTIRTPERLLFVSFLLTSSRCYRSSSVSIVDFEYKLYLSRYFYFIQ